jgi:uncharacterized protein with beta-barrel porin domain
MASFSKNPPMLPPVREKRWNFWSTSFGDFVHVDSDFSARGYKFTTGGIDLGIDYLLTDHLAFGLMGNYAGPIASLQYTNVDVDGFREQGSLAPLSIHSDSEESLRTDVGFRASYQWQVGSVSVEPFLKATWEHEFKYSALPISAGFADISGPSATFLGPAESHDSAVVDAGLSVSRTPTISTPKRKRDRP